MKLEQQVCSLELAKQLKELGVKPESLFYWVSHKDISSAGIGTDIRMRKTFLLELTDEVISAFTVAELGEMLPWDLTLSRNIYKEWIMTFEADGMTEDKVYSVKGKSEADVRAKMLIYLIENKLIEVEIIN